MADTETVIWSEGMFLRPQHFQQYTRYLESFVEDRTHVFQAYPWGFSELSLDDNLLSLGKIGIVRAKGVYCDGTPFNIPNVDEFPSAIEVSEKIKDQLVYLCVPLRRPGTVNVEYKGDKDSLARYVPAETELLDNSTLGGREATIQVGKLRSKLILQPQHRDEYACLAIARIIEVRANKSIVLDDSFIPTVVNCQAASRLSSFIGELEALLSHRCEVLVGRLAAASRGSGASDISDFLMLQLVNRYLPLVKHIKNSAIIHPEYLYQFLISFAGEFATFTATNKQPPDFVPYKHDDLASSFDSVFSVLRHSLSMVIEQTAIPLPLQERNYGIQVAVMQDKSLLEKSIFVVAVGANLPQEDVLKRFSSLVKIAPVEMIRDLIIGHLPGIKIRPLPAAPRQIPFRAEFVYFELERSGEVWANLKNSGGFAFHIGGDFPGIKLEFWAIRA